MDREQTLRSWVASRSSAVHEARVDNGCEGRPVRAPSLCIASGKGGTGKSIVTASLSELLSARGRTLLVDADMGVGNAHILHDVHPPRSLVDVVYGRCDLPEARTRCSSHLDLLAGGCGVSHMTALSGSELHRIAQGLARVEPEYDFLLVDSAAGISDQTLLFATSCDAVLVVTTPDATAMTDAYAFIKVLHARKPEAVPLLAINRVTYDGANGEMSAQRVADRLSQVCTKFLGLAPKPIGAVPDDRAVVRSVAARRPVVRDAPRSDAALALRSLAVAVLDELAALRPHGLARALGEQLEFFSTER